jgi:hypothetical protein
MSDNYLMVNKDNRRAVELVGDTIRYCKATPNFQRVLPVWPDAVEFTDDLERQEAAHRWLRDGITTLKETVA